VRSQLAKGKVAAENGESPSAESLGQCHEEPRVAVRSSAVSKDEAIPCRTMRAVQVSSNAYFIYQKVTKLSVAVHTHRVLQPRGLRGPHLHPVCRELRMACFPFGRAGRKRARHARWGVCVSGNFFRIFGVPIPR
jgi:hypothetical protein